MQEYIDLDPIKIQSKILKYANQIRTVINNNYTLQLVGIPESKSAIIGIIAISDAVQKEITSNFGANGITIKLLHE